MAILNPNTLNPILLKQTDLHYVEPNIPGIQRQKRGRGYSFIAPDGQIITCKTERERLLKIAVPPTYNSVWYCPLPNGHLQATGHDSKNKKQYFYHEHWEYLRTITKYENLQTFSEHLPAFRRKIAASLKDTIINKTTILSAMARILDKTGIRIGNDLATQTNKTHGLTTLKKQHIDVEDNTVRIEYIAKSYTEIEKQLTDQKIAQIIENCAEIPGQRLFEYKDDNGVKRDIDSSDMNIFIKKNMDDTFSAKDFRIWRFSCMFLKHAIKHMQSTNKPVLKNILEHVAEQSGNTPSILQSSYIHPGLIQCVKQNDPNPLTPTTQTIPNLTIPETQLATYLKSPHAQKALKQ